MAKKRSSPARACFKILRKGNPERTMTVTGKSFKDAQAAGKRLLKRMGVNPDKFRPPKWSDRYRRRQSKPLSFGERMKRLRAKRERAARR